MLKTLAHTPLGNAFGNRFESHPLEYRDVTSLLNCSKRDRTVFGSLQMHCNPINNASSDSHALKFRMNRQADQTKVVAMRGDFDAADDLVQRS